MEQKRCSVLNCNKPLSTVQEVMNGICNDCFEKLRDDRYYAGVCWHCQTITSISLKRTSFLTQKERRWVEIKDKYIFAKGCQKCTGDPKMGIMWMTINKEDKSNLTILDNRDTFPLSILMEEETYSTNNRLNSQQKEVVGDEQLL